MSKIALLLALPAVLLVLGGVVIVDVREDGPDGPRIWLPVPLPLAQAALALAPGEARAVDLPALEPYLPAAAALLEALAGQPDFTILEVDEGRDRVLVRKEGDRLVIDVREGENEQVSCRLPLRTARRLLDACRDGELGAGEALRAMALMPSGRLVQVRDGGSMVSIRKI